MPDAMQLLNLAANVTQNAYGRIDQAMSQSLQIQQRAGEFEVGMAAKAVEFAENQRMNNARLEEMRAANALRAKEFEIKAALLPLQFQTANLNLERSRYLMAKEREQMGIASFNQITELEDAASAHNLIRTQDPSHAKELIQLKSKYRAQVADGSEFDRDSYVKEQSLINEKYKDVVADPTAPFSDQTHYLLGEISPRVQSIYEKKKFSGTTERRALALSYLNLPPTQAAEFASKYGHILAEELPMLSVSQTAFQASQERMESAAKAANALFTELSQINKEDEPQRWASTAAQAEAYDRQRKESFDAMMEIQARVSTGRYTTTADEMAPVNKPQGPNPADFTEPDIKTLSGISADQKDVVGQVMRVKIKAVHDELDLNAGKGMGERLLGDVDLSWFTNPEKWDKGKPDDRTLTNIKSRIENKIESLDNIGDVFTEKTVNAILNKVPMSDGIPISEALAEDLHKSGHFVFGARDQGISYNPDSPTKPYFRIGGSGKSIIKDSITSYDDIVSLIDKLPRSKQKAASEEIYAALLTASLSHVVTNK